MVCAALSNDSRKTSTMTETSDLQVPVSMSKPAASLIPPAVIISEEEANEEESISINELRQQNELNSPSNNTNQYWSQQTGRASSSPQIPQDITWAPLLHGRSIDRSASSLYSRPTNFTSETEQQMEQRQRSSSATSITVFLDADSSKQNKSIEKKAKETSLNAKHSFMALIRIKMFSMKRHRKNISSD